VEEKGIGECLAPCAVPLLFFVNTLARTHFLAKSASVSGQVNRFSNPNYAFSFRPSPLSIRSHLPNSHDPNYLRAHTSRPRLLLSLTSPWSQKWPRQVLSINLVWASRYASLLYPYPCLSLEKNDALVVHATPHGSLAWQSSGLPVKI
jgi:hypothetical protein